MIRTITFALLAINFGLLTSYFWVNGSVWSGLGTLAVTLIFSGCLEEGRVDAETDGEAVYGADRD